jgi:hypothetical protein
MLLDNQVCQLYIEEASQPQRLAGRAGYNRGGGGERPRCSAESVRRWGQRWYNATNIEGSDIWMRVSQREMGIRERK